MTSVAGRGRTWRRVLALGAPVLVLGLPAPMAAAAEPVPASLSDVRAKDAGVSTTLVLRSDKEVTVDPASIKVTLGGRPATVTVTPATQQPRSTMLVIDTSGSMGASGMGTVRSAVRNYLAAVPDDVKVGVVSFASTSGVDVAPTTNRAKVQHEVAGYVSKGETALYSAVQDAVKALGTKGERSIVLLSDGGDTVAEIEGGAARAAAQKKAALNSLSKAKVRAEVVAFKSPESNNDVLQQFAKVGGGSVANAADRAAVSRAFTAAARTLESQAVLDVKRPAGVTGSQEVVVTGTAGGSPFEARSTIDLGDIAPVVATSDDEIVVAGPVPADSTKFTALSPILLIPAIGVLMVGLFLLSVAFMGPVFRSKRSERVSAIEAYGLGRAAPAAKNQASPSALGEQIVHMGERVMSGRESTTRTMQLMDRADLPWRAGEWLVLRLVAVVVCVAAGMLLFSGSVIGPVLGLVVGFALPPLGLRFLAKRRARKFEGQLPDVLMLVATSLSSGFSLLQALDSVARDAPEPAMKEFSRALAEARIGADISDALDHMGERMNSVNMRWATMAIRIQREVGGNLAETLRTTAATLREREMLKRQVKALSAEGRLSAYVLVALPVGVFFFSWFRNYDYVSLLWTTPMGLVMSIGGLISLGLGIFWMTKVVKIEV
jgi:tight adherence protein B